MNQSINPFVLEQRQAAREIFSEIDDMPVGRRSAVVDLIGRDIEEPQHARAYTMWTGIEFLRNSDNPGKLQHSLATRVQALLTTCRDNDIHRYLERAREGVLSREDNWGVKLGLIIVTAVRRQAELNKLTASKLAHG